MIINARIMGGLINKLVFIAGICYAAVTMLGLQSLPAPDQPIGDPYFTWMELLTLVIAPLMVAGMAMVHRWAAPPVKGYSLVATLFLLAMCVITSCVHVTILILTRQLPPERVPELAPMIGFRWPSLAYVLDVAAWDWFYALGVLFAAPVFLGIGKREKATRWLLLLSGVLSLIGLAGIPLQDMQVRNIGILGYAVVGPVAFLFMGWNLSASKKLQT